MELGLFLMPSHPPERTLYEAQQWDLKCIKMADRFGLKEAWIGEHFTAPWEPIPSPDILIAQALMQTNKIKLGTGAHLLPFHHPIELASRVAYLDHLAQGRYMFGIGSGGLQSDHELFGVDMENGEHRDMTRESLDIILNLWKHIDGPFKYEGRFWTINIPNPDDYAFANLRAHITPYQKPHPPIGVAGASPGSDTLKLVGERGYIPMSLGLNEVYVASHWDAVMEGAKNKGKTPPSRREWRIVRDIWVAETDEEAREGAIKGMLGRAWEEYLLPLFSNGAYPFVTYMKHDQSLQDEDVTIDYMLDNLWVVGSPDTVIEKLKSLYHTVGGFGHLLWLTYDHSEQSEAYETSMRLLAEKVMPELSSLTGE